MVSNDTFDRSRSSSAARVDARRRARYYFFDFSFAFSPAILRLHLLLPFRLLRLRPTTTRFPPKKKTTQKKKKKKKIHLHRCSSSRFFSSLSRALSCFEISLPRRVSRTRIFSVNPGSSLVVGCAHRTTVSARRRVMSRSRARSPGSGGAVSSRTFIYLYLIKRRYLSSLSSNQSRFGGRLFLSRCVSKVFLIPTTTTTL